MFYKILSTIKFDTNFLPWAEWSIFKCDEKLSYDLHIRIDIQSCYRYGIEVLGEQPGKAVLKCEDCLLSVNEDWSKAKITIFNNSVQDMPIVLNALLMTHLSLHNALLLHASVISQDNKGILFLGPSGIGKTTQAELWKQCLDSEIINGDMVYVKKEESKFLGCGSPWHGSSPYCLNKQVPLSALIVLKQSKQNTIRRLTGFEMVSSVMSSVFWPTWYREGYEAACETFDTLLNTVPVYELSCRPDEGAVKLTEETIFGK